MYVDGAKTLITAAGIAVALLASTAKPTVGTSDSLVVFSARAAGVSLILCVMLSLVVIFALMRNFDNAQSRFMETQRKENQKHIDAGQRELVRKIEAGQGELTKNELLFTLAFAWPALSCFLVGFAFLGRIVYHF